MPRRPAFILPASLLIALACAAQTPKGDLVAGTVVSSSDGHPLSNAAVILEETRTGQVVAKTASDGEGRYRFESVAPGKYRLAASANRFLPAAYLEHEAPFSTAIVTGAGLATDALALRLAPLATISGHIVDDLGDSVEAVAVTLYREGGEGAQKATRVENANANDEGEFEFSNLAPGHYFVSAEGAPWYAPGSELGFEPEFVDDAEKLAFQPAIDPALTVTYPAVFYPNASSSEGASPIPIEGGEHVSVELHVHPVRTVTVSAPRKPEDEGGGALEVTQMVFGVPETVAVFGFQTRGRELTANLAPGQYQVRRKNSVEGFSGEAETVDISGNTVLQSRPSGLEAETVSVTLHSTDGKTPPPNLNLQLKSLHSPATERVMGNQGVFTFNHVPGGAYRFLVSDNGKSLAVTAVSVNGEAMPGHELRIAKPGKLSVEVSFSPASVEVNGFATRAGSPGTGSTIALVPVDAGTGDELLRFDQSDLDGSFTLFGVAPGRYILVAIDDGWAVRPRGMTGLAPYLAHGIPVSVPPGASSPIHLKETVSTQPR